MADETTTKIIADTIDATAAPAKAVAAMVGKTAAKTATTPVTKAWGAET